MKNICFGDVFHKETEYASCYYSRTMQWKMDETLFNVVLLNHGLVVNSVNQSVLLILVFVLIFHIQH